MTAPVIQTARLTLRPHTQHDLEAGVRLWSDPVTLRHIGIKPSGPSEAWSRMLRYLGMWPFCGFGYWAVEETVGGAFVGDVGFGDFKRTIEPSILGLPEMGWVIAQQFHGRGYATEAVRAALAWADDRLDASRTVCIINAANVASIRVAEKCGFNSPRSTSFGDEPTLLFSRPRSGQRKEA